MMPLRHNFFSTTDDEFWVWRMCIIWYKLPCWLCAFFQLQGKTNNDLEINFTMEFFILILILPISVVAEILARVQNYCAQTQHFVATFTRFHHGKHWQQRQELWLASLPARLVRSLPELRGRVVSIQPGQGVSGKVWTGARRHSALPWGRGTGTQYTNSFWGGGETCTWR